MRISYLILIVLLNLIAACKKTHQTTPVDKPPTDTVSTGWTRVNIIPLHSPLIDIFFVGDTGFATGNYSIYKSNDGGSDWNYLYNSPFGPPGLLNSGMGSKNNACFVGGGNKLICTRNGGINFDTVSVNDNNLSDVFYVTSTTAFAIGNSFWKTNDAGITWTKLYNFPISFDYNSLYFLDSLSGWVMRANGLFKTVDGGHNWQNINVGGVIDLSKGGFVFLVDTSHGFISDNRTVAATTDGGNTWSVIYRGKYTLHDIHFVSNNVGYITDESRIMKTTDAGATWTPVVGLADGGTIMEIHFTDANHGWGCSLNSVFKYQQ